MRLQSGQYEEIKRTVIDTFVEYNVKSIPISAFEVAIKMGLKVIPYSSLSKQRKIISRRISLDGYSTDMKNGAWLIYYNDECNNYGRINQTIMHEIGHYALGHIKDGEIEETEAKFFAKYALAPPPLVHTLRKVNPVIIENTFDISHQAACYAYRYYKGWLKFGKDNYTDYEIKLLELFECV